MDTSDAKSRGGMGLVTWETLVLEPTITRIKSSPPNTPPKSICTKSLTVLL
jgi:hypothetical protein